ncbi:MAG: type II toxin-antitoxin system HicB family antitoxin [Methylococcales bacterium]|nr:MAG: type II toxin-antitoxin system HicB family antitoxin [Methylococcales bacterium]
MRTIKFTSWQNDNFFIGFINEYPDYQTQCITKEELIENMKDLLNDIEYGQVPSAVIIRLFSVFRAVSG